jgi:hypothetical protein
MWGLTTVVSAFALAIVAMSLGFMGGAVIVAVPLAIIAIAVAGLVDFNRRRKTAKSIHSHRREDDRDIEFTDRDRRTLLSD